MVWDGTRWVRNPAHAHAPSTATSRKRVPVRPLPVLVAALAAVLVASLIGAVVPDAPSVASSPTLRLDPAAAEPGSVVEVYGEHLLPFVPYQLTWDGSAAGQPELVTDQLGDLEGSWTVPAASPGAHEVSVFPVGHVSGTTVATVASATFAVDTDAVALGGPVSTLDPVELVQPLQTVVPTVAPKPAPLTVARTSPPAKPTSAPAKPSAPKTPPPKPRPAGPWSVPFLDRAASGPIVIRNRSNVVVSGKRFVNLPAGQVAIVIENSSNVTITANDFSGNTGDILAVDSKNITVTWNRYRNVGNGVVGSGQSNFVQFARTIGGTIAHNKGIGGNTEDIISMFESHGASAASPTLIEDNAFEGTDWSSDSGSGIMLGDDGGSHIVVRGNILVTPGQVGIGIASGTDIHVIDNLVYGAKRAGSNVGIAIWNQTSGSCSGDEIRGNKVTWYSADGSRNAAWDGGGCGSVAGWSSNDWNANLRYASLHVVL